jgi:cephalosporin-C deacetylase-like acetyl esterase
MLGDLEPFKYYPSREEVDKWVDSIWKLADSTHCKVEVLNSNGFSKSMGVNHVSEEFTYVKFIPERMDEFYGYWQPVMSGPAPLLFHVPGYGAEMSTHPDLVAQGYNVLHVSPLGFVTPEGPDESKKRNGNWPVLPDTVISGAEKGYKLWLMNCILAIRWAMTRPEVIENRVSFYGTSQGGGASLLLGSLYRDRGVRCVAADLPFLTNYPMGKGRGAYFHAVEGLNEVEDKRAAWKALGLVDTLSHAERLSCPVLLTSGGRDEVCPAETIESLYRILPGTKSYTHFINLAHRYTREFIPLAAAWFRLYA